ncbi:MAG: ferrochelatase [Anaerolineae bacterium]|nr:ferrochelatase [Anaerolineae bacterium]
MAEDANKIGVLVAQLGTPDAPTAASLRKYLREFLSDMRVIDYHPLVWQPILNLIILNVRPPKSARLYQRVWLDEGSPLLVYSQRQVTGLQDRLGERYRVILGMTYGEPSIRAALRQFEADDIDRIVVLPMYPQYSSTTTASVYDAVYDAAGGRRSPLAHERKRFVPALRFVPPFADHPAYIAAMQSHLRQIIERLPQPPDHYLLSFHGIPERYARTGDPYREECEHTAQALAQAMDWNEGEWRMTFQSRFGPEPWLQPYTDKTLIGLHAEGIERPLIFAPGFSADCLETLDELGNEGRAQFVEGGGSAESYTCAPCLNDDPAWLDALAQLVETNAQGF